MACQLYHDVNEVLLTSSTSNDAQYDDNDEKNDNHCCCCSSDDVEHQVVVRSRRYRCNYIHRRTSALNRENVTDTNNYTKRYHSRRLMDIATGDGSLGSLASSGSGTSTGLRLLNTALWDVILVSLAILDCRVTGSCVKNHG